MWLIGTKQAIKQQEEAVAHYGLAKRFPFNEVITRCASERIQWLRSQPGWTGIVRLNQATRDAMKAHHVWFNMDATTVLGEGFRIDNSLFDGEVDTYAMGDVGNPLTPGQPLTS